MIQTNFWTNPIVSEEMTPEDKYFFLYLLTNPHTTQIGIYRITKKQMAFDTGYSIETIHSLMDRMDRHHQVIRYNPDTRELAIKNWGKYNLHKGGKPVIDCIISELQQVQDTSLIPYVAEHITKTDIQTIFKSFYEKEEGVEEEQGHHPVTQPYIESENTENDAALTTRHTMRGQKEKENKKEKEKQQQNTKKKKEEVKEIIELWDQNGFGYSNMNAKEQLLCWLDDSRFLNPKDVIVKAMTIACTNNIRKLNYVVGILKNWENEGLLTVEEIDLYHKKKPTEQEQPAEHKGKTKEFQLNLSEGEDW
ncbi:DnaD domain-containing protein [Litchfieldia salsa]